jgi:hypothetical protein
VGLSPTLGALIVHLTGALDGGVLVVLGTTDYDAEVDVVFRELEVASSGGTAAGKGLGAHDSGDGGGAGLLRLDGWLLGGGPLGRGLRGARLGDFSLAQDRLGRLGAGGGAGRTTRSHCCL